MHRTIFFSVITMAGAVADPTLQTRHGTIQFDGTGFIIS